VMAAASVSKKAAPVFAAPFIAPLKKALNHGGAPR
jgi:hypothetical protein